MDIPENVWVRTNKEKKKLASLAGLVASAVAQDPVVLPEIGQTMMLTVDSWGAYGTSPEELVDGRVVVLVEVKEIRTASVKTTTELL